MHPYEKGILIFFSKGDILKIRGISLKDFLKNHCTRNVIFYAKACILNCMFHEDLILKIMTPGPILRPQEGSKLTEIYTGNILKSSS